MERIGGPRAINIRCYQKGKIETSILTCLTCFSGKKKKKKIGKGSIHSWGEMKSFIHAAIQQAVTEFSLCSWYYTSMKLESTPCPQIKTTTTMSFAHYLKKYATLRLWSLLRETALSYDVSSVLPRDSQSNWLIESQNAYLPGFIHFYYLIDFPVSWLWKYISEGGQLDSHSKEKFFGSDT